MKNLIKFTFITSLFAALLLTAAAQQADSTTAAKADAAIAAAVTQSAASETKPADAVPAADTGNKKDIRMSFSGARLESVLTHMAAAAGYVITVDPRVLATGRVTIIANQPVDRDEAYHLLAGAAAQNNLTVSRDGRNLYVTSVDNAIKTTPIIPGNMPAVQIPNTPKMVTQMIAVKQANAAQLTQDLIPLLPDNAVMTANTAGNVLVITAAQSDVKRMAELVEALDATISNNTSIKVFPLKHADAKEMETIVKGLFDSSSQRGGAGGRGGAGNLQFQIGGGGRGG